MTRVIHESQTRIEQVIAALQEELGPHSSIATERPIRHAIALLHGVLDTLIPLHLPSGKAPGARHATLIPRPAAVAPQACEANAANPPGTVDKGSEIV